MRYEIPEQFLPDFKYFSLGDAFCTYSFIDLAGQDDEFHSAWVIEFFGRTRFFAMVSANEAGWPRQTFPQTRAGAEL